MQYKISCAHPNRHYINIEVTAATNGNDKMTFHLPAWRPGRYELANYAQNVQIWDAYNEKGEKLHSHKLTKDSWNVDTKGAKEVTIKYNFFAYQMDAGASYYDEQQLYINPVNCLLYIEEKINEKCILKLSIPEDFKIASALKFNTSNEAETVDFHHLADSPFICSLDLMHREYSVGEYLFHIWIQGNAKPDWNKIIHDFTRFSEAQIKIFGELPIKEYHFLYQLPNHKFYHGVEHLDSTVICLGPAYRLMEKDVYSDFLGVSCHELFHSWNIKSIRPIEMMPYEYSRENYSNLGYVCEGVTTYYGDYMLLRGGVFNFDEYAHEFCKTLQKHFHMFGKDYMNLAQSSFDTWLDGYKPGIPDRKISMYFKGMIVAFMTDIALRRDTKNASSLDTVMSKLYNEFAKKNKGYSEEDYLKIVSEFSGRSYKQFFDQYIWGLEPLEEYLNECVSYIGCQLMTYDNHDTCEALYGFKIKEENSKSIIIQIAPNSPADKSLLSVNDEIIAVNGMQCDKNSLNELLRFHHGETIALSLFRSRELIYVPITSGDETYFANYILVKKDNASEEEKANFHSWAGVKF